MIWTQAHNQTADANQIIAERSTRYIVFWIVLSYVMLAFSAFAFSLTMIFGAAELETGRLALLLCLIIGPLLVFSVVCVAVSTNFAISVPGVLIKNLDGTLYLCPRRKDSISIDSLQIDKIDCRLYANAMHFVMTTIITFGYISAGKTGKSGKIIITTKDNKKIRLRFIKDVEIAYYLLEKSMEQV